MVQHNPWFKFSFVSKLLSCIPIPKTKENNIKTRLKLNHNTNIYSHFFSNASSRHGLQWKKKCRFTLIVTFTSTVYTVTHCICSIKNCSLVTFQSIMLLSKNRKIIWQCPQGQNLGRQEPKLFSVRHYSMKLGGNALAWFIDWLIFHVIKRFKDSSHIPANKGTNLSLRLTNYSE